MPTPIANRVGVSFDGYFGPGTPISLDLTKAAFIGIDGGFCLTSRSPTGVIPVDINEKGLADLRRALDHGVIVLGNTPKRPPAAEDKLTKTCASLDECKDIEEAKKIISALYVSYRSPRRRMDLAVILDKVLTFELQNKNREDIVGMIRRGIDKLEGPSVVRETSEPMKLPLPSYKVTNEAAEVPTANNPDI
jgi:hypothetical protein